MAGKVKIDSATARGKLKLRREPYWVKLQARGYLGFRRTADGGTWVARWRDEQGKHHYRALGLEVVAPEQAFDDAAKAAQAWFKGALAGVVAKRTVSDAATLYVEGLRLRKGEAAAHDAQGRIDRCILPKIGERPLDRLTTAEVERWLHGLVPAGPNEDDTRRAKDSANRNLVTFKALLNHGWRMGLVASNSAWSRVKAFEKAGQARTVFLSPEQRKRLLENCGEGAFRDLVEAAMLTGARYGELRSLMVGDFDKARRTLSIRTGKTGPRVVPLSDAAVGLFGRLARRKLPGAVLLPRPDGEVWAHSDQDELMREAVKKAKLPRGTVFYTLRHTFIASALTGGLDIHAVAKICGTSVRMIELHYGKLLHTDVREALNKVAFA